MTIYISHKLEFEIDIRVGFYIIFLKYNFFAFIKSENGENKK